MQVIIVQLFGWCLAVLMAKWCGKSLYLFGGTKRERWLAFAFSGASAYLFPFWTTILLMYLLTQAFADARDGYVDIRLNLEGGAVMAAAAMILLPKLSGVLWIVLVAVALRLFGKTFSSGDQKGLFVCALWGLIYLNHGTGIFASGQVLSMPAIFGFLISLIGIVIYGTIVKKRYDVPLFPWMFFGYSITAGAMRFM